MSYIPTVNKRSWLDSEFVCALAHNVHHLGHLIKTDKWHAYETTYLNDDPKGFKYLGAFIDLAVAKRAVESSVADPTSIIMEPEGHLRWAEDGGFTN